MLYMKTKKKIQHIILLIFLLLTQIAKFINMNLFLLLMLNKNMQLLLIIIIC